MNGFGGEVVASWMTKRDRLEEIHDFSVYCSTLYDSYVQKLPDSCKTIIMGFSQGGVTAMRWLHHLDVTVDFLIPYACWIPEDIDYLTAKTDWNKICKILTYGSEDQFLNEKKIIEIQDDVNNKKKEEKDLENDIKKLLVDGGYLINPNVTVRLLNAKVTILGEVKIPGTFSFTENNISLLQALGLAGDLTINGSREDVVVLRRVNGVQTTARIDLTSANFLSGPYQMVKPNDVIVNNKH